MKIYFLSSKPCALTLNGVFFGLTDSFERSADVAIADKLFVQFSPEGDQPIGFFLTENIRIGPPAGCEVYLLPDGIAIYAYDFPPSDFSLRPIAQLREEDLLATLYRQGKLCLSVESPKGFFNATLPPSFAPRFLSLEGDFLFLKGEDDLGVYDLTCRLLLLEKVVSYEFSDGELTALLPLSDSRRRRAKCRWRLNEEGATLLDFALQSPETADLASETPEDLIAYAFFETVLLRGNYGVFFSEELQPDKEQIRAFLGDFIAVTLTEKPTVCGLVRKKGERLYLVERFEAVVENGKIVDVRDFL